MLEPRPRLFALEAAVLVFGFVLTAGTALFLFLSRPFYFPADIVWQTKVVLASSPVLMLQAALLLAVVLVRLAERFGADRGIGSRLRRTIPRGLRTRKLFALALLSGLICLEVLACFIGAGMSPMMVLDNGPVFGYPSSR